MSTKCPDLVGQKFGLLTVISRSGNNKYGSAQWNCLCDCGFTTVCITGNLRSGGTTSCGCVGYETQVNNGKKTGPARKTHGMWGSKIYNTWRSIKKRCENNNEDSYALYGGRGITVCERWAHSFEAFYEDVGDPPSDKHSIDRIDVNGNYEPSNCRWLTQKEQCRNQRRNRVIDTPKGKMLLCEAAEISGISSSTLHGRLKSNWPISRLFDKK